MAATAIILSDTEPGGETGLRKPFDDSHDTGIATVTWRISVKCLCTSKPVIANTCRLYYGNALWLWCVNRLRVGVNKLGSLPILPCLSFANLEVETRHKLVKKKNPLPWSASQTFRLDHLGEFGCQHRTKLVQRRRSCKYQLSASGGRLPT